MGSAGITRFPFLRGVDGGGVILVWQRGTFVVR
jgi:hypothetical protein